MCICSPTNLTHRYCGKGACLHPTTGAAQREHDARASEPKPSPVDHHPAVVASHLGFDFSTLDAIIVAAENGTVPPVLPSDRLAHLVDHAKATWAAAHNNARHDARGHYRTMAKIVDDARRIFDAVNESRTSVLPATQAVRLRAAREMLHKAIGMLLTPPTGAYGTNPSASPARGREVV